MDMLNTDNSSNKSKMESKVKTSIVKSLFSLGQIEVLSIKDSVFTLMVKGNNMTSFSKVNKIQSVLSENGIDTKYPVLDVMKNEDDYLIMVMSSQQNATLIEQNNLLKSFIDYHRQRMEDDQRVHITIRLLIENYDKTLKDTENGK